MSAIRGVGKRILAAASAHKRELSIFLLIIGTFAWTNWYFSPEKRFDRIAQDMFEFGSQEVSSDDVGRMMSFLQVGVGGGTSISTSCSVTPCRVTLSQYYYVPARGGKSEMSWSLSVTATLDPYFSKGDAVHLLPAKIEWKQIGWEWTIGVTDQRDRTKNSSYSGRMTQLDRIPKFDGKDTVSSILRALAVGMAKGLQFNE